MYVGLDTSLFRNLRINIFVYYFITVITFLAMLHYFVNILQIESLSLLIIVIVCFVILSGVFISKLAIDPLEEYVRNLQNLSKETLHELNLPISTIVTNTQMLRKSLSDEKSLKRIERVDSACEMLKQRYNELDYMIKMQSKQDVNENFFVDALVQERVTLLSKLYPNTSFNLSLEKIEVFNDKTGLAKVIDNIIDNGVKYSLESKEIDINIKNDTLFIQDFGIGMDEVELLHIFDQYYQSNSSMQGFGIGLNMVKRFCDKNDVILNFKSSKNVGTTVELKFKKL